MSTNGRGGGIAHSGFRTLTAGLLQQALGDLKQTLFIISFTGLSLTAAGIFLRTGTQGNSKEPAGIAPGD